MFNRKNVIQSLKNAKFALEKLKIGVFHKGVILFSGNGVTKTITDFERPLRRSGYKCDNKFDLDILYEIRDSSTDPIFLFVILDGTELLISSLQGDHIKNLNNLKSKIKSRTRRGGQSALRFDRLRDNSEFQFVSTSIEMVNEQLKVEKFNGIVLAGKADVKNLFIANCGNHIKKQIIGVFDISASGKEGLLQAIEKSEETRLKQNNIQEEETLKFFFELMQTDPERLTIGKNETRNFLLQGRLKTLLVSEKYYTPKRIANAEKFGTEVKKIKAFSSQGHMFCTSYSGICGIKRY